MSIKLSDSIRVGQQKPLEDKYFNELVPYTSTSQVNTLIPKAVRHIGLTVNINREEYWYKDGIEDSNLVLKITNSDTSNLVPYTGANKDVNIASNYFKTSKGFNFTYDESNYFKTDHSNSYNNLIFYSEDSSNANFGYMFIEASPEIGFVVNIANGDGIYNSFHATESRTYSEKPFVSSEGFKTPTGTANQSLTADGGVFDLNTKADLVGGKIPASQLPAYVDDVLEYANLASFPATGESGKIYIAIDTNKTYRWSGSTYVEITASPSSTDSVVEGTTNLYFTDARAQSAVTTITGNAGTATKLQTARTISVTGDGTGNTTFDGSNNTSIALTLANSGVNAGTYGSSSTIPVVTVDTKGRVTSVTTQTITAGSSTLSALADVALTSATSGQLLLYNGSKWVNTTPNYLTTNQTITVSGDATGSGTTSLTLTLANSGVTSGTYKSVTVDAKGRVTAGSNPTTLSGYGITDAVSSSLLGANSGVATLDSTGRVPATQLPSYVDDVLEYANLASFPATGESGKIYIAIDTNLTYRWGGSSYVVMSSSLALGETSSTAYRGDRGKIAYDHSQATGNPHGTKVEELTDIGSETPSIADTDVILKKESGGLWKKITFANFKNWFTTELAKKINIGLDTVFNFKNISAMTLTEFRSITPNIETIYFTEEQNATGWQQIRYNGLGITIPATTETLVSLTNENFIELNSDSTFNLIDIANTKINGIFEKDFVIIKFNAGVVTPATANQWFKVILKVNNVQTAVSPVFYLTETSGTVEQIAHNFALDVPAEMATNGATLHLKTSTNLTFNNPAISVARVHKSTNANL